MRKLAERFGVAKSFVQKLIKKYQETGDIRPLAQGGSPPNKLNIALPNLMRYSPHPPNLLTKALAS